MPTPTTTDPRVRVAAAALCEAWADHAADFAQLARGGTLDDADPNAAIGVAGVLAAAALGVLTALPLPEWWQGYAANLSGAVEALLGLAVEYRTAGRWPDPIDAGAAARGVVDALALGLLTTTRGIAVEPAPLGDPAYAALYATLDAMGTEDADALRSHLSGAPANVE